MHHLTKALKCHPQNLQLGFVLLPELLVDRLFLVDVLLLQQYQAGPRQAAL